MGLFLSCFGTLGVPLEWRRVCQGTSCVASRGSRTLLRLKRDVDLSQDIVAEKGLISRSGENLLVFLDLRQKPWGSSLVMKGTSGTRSCCIMKVKSPWEVRGAS